MWDKYIFGLEEAAVPVINDNADYKFEIGKAITLREGTDVTIIAANLTVSESLAATEISGRWNQCGGD